MQSDYAKFGCPHCHQHIEAPADMAGETIECPRCRGKVIVPSFLIKATEHPKPEIVPPPAPPPPAPQSMPSSQPAAIVINRQTLIIAGAILCAVLAIVAVGMTISRGSSKWERQNRDALIKMATDGHISFSANDRANALATYEVLFELIGSNEVRDVTLKATIDKARSQHRQLVQLRQDQLRQKNMLIQGSVVLSLKNGTRIFPQTQVFLFPADSPAVKDLRQLKLDLTKLISCNREAEQAKAMLDSGRHGGLTLAETRQYLDARQNNLEMALQLTCDIPIEVTKVVGHAALTTKTDSEGRFMFAQMGTGRFSLLAIATVNDKDVYWISDVEKVNEPLTISLNNDNAIVR